MQVGSYPCLLDSRVQACVAEAERVQSRQEKRISGHQRAMEELRDELEKERCAAKAAQEKHVAMQVHPALLLCQCRVS